MVFNKGPPGGNPAGDMTRAPGGPVVHHLRTAAAVAAAAMPSDIPKWPTLPVSIRSRGCYLAEDLRRPWERAAAPDRLTPARVRRGLPRIRATMPLQASAPKPSRPGPGRPAGSKNTRPTQHHLVGKRTKTETTTQASGRPGL